MQNTSGPKCEICGYIGEHANWCNAVLSGVSPGPVCKTCGQAEGQPGYIKNLDMFGREAMSKLLPCPDCHTESFKKLVRSQMDGTLLSKTFDNFVVLGNGAQALNAAKDFAINPKGWLTLYGQHGPGKTHLAAAIANQMGARYYNAPDLANSFFGQSNEVVDDLQRHKVIILDELDKVHWQTSNGVAWVREQFQRIFDHRYRNLDTHGLVIATNEPPAWYDDDLLFIQSRMLDQRFECVYMSGDNRPIAAELEA